jgi:hypothetical protein
MKFHLLRRSVASTCLLATLALTTTVKGAGQALTSARKAGDTDRVEATLEVGGTLKMVGESGVQKLKMTASGTAKYHEKLFQRATPDWVKLRALREYEACQATIQVEERTTTPTLRPERASIVVAGQEKVLQLFGVDGPLTRDELELIELPCNTAILDELLPAKPVAAGDTWDHSAELTAALFGLDAAGVSDLKSKLMKVEGNAATIELNGQIQGAIKGVTTKIDVKARYKFDLKSKRVTWVGLLLKEDRSIGHVGPGMEITAKLQITIQPGAKHEKLAAMNDAGALQELAPEHAMLEYEPPKGYYRLLYDRRWHVMTDEPNLVSMRLVDRGELLAQAKVSTPVGASHTQTATIQAFQQEIQKSLAEEFGQFVESTTSENSLGVTTHRVVVHGVVSELPIEWRYYLLVGPGGRQVVVAFTLEQEQASRFGNADETLIDCLEFAQPKPGETAKAVRLKVPVSDETAQTIRLKVR